MEKTNGLLSVTLEGKKTLVKVGPSEGVNDYLVHIDEEVLEVHLGEETESTIALTVDGEVVKFERPRAAEAAGGLIEAKTRRVEEDVLVSPMPGRIISVEAKAGGLVKVGTPLVTLESMKMESVLRSDRAGRIDQVLVKQGDTVKRDQALVRFK